MTVLIGLIAGVVYAVMTLLFSPEQIGIAAAVYHHAGTALLDGELLYDVSPPDRPGYYFLYPPIIGLLFVPHALVGGEIAAHAFQTGINLVAGVTIAILVLRTLERRGTPITRLDRALILGFVLVSIHGLNQLVMGQINHVLALAIAAGLVGLDRHRTGSAGMAFGVAALLKVFPTTLGLWLVRVRAWRGVATAIATGLGGLLLGAIVLGPDLTAYYFTDVLLARFDAHTFPGTPDPTWNHTTVRRQLAALLGGSSALITPITIAIFALVVGLLYRRIDDEPRRLTAILGTLVVTLLVLPLQPLYFILLAYPWLLVLYRLPPGPGRTAIIAGTIFTYLLIGQEIVADTLAILPAGIEATILAATSSLFTVILPPTIGMWLLIIGCLLVHYR